VYSSAVTSDLGFVQIAAPSARRRFSAPSFLDEVDRHGDRAGIGRARCARGFAAEEFLRGVVEVKGDAGSALRRVFKREGRDGERAFAV